MCFKGSNPPPFYDLNIPPMDHSSSKTEKSKTGETVDDSLPGYAEERKGKGQVLWKRGLWVDGTRSSENVPDHQNIEFFWGVCCLQEREP